MKPYNVEIFSRTFDLLLHTNVNDVSVEFDYLTPNESEITLRAKGFLNTIGVGAYIRIEGNGTDVFGVVTSVDATDDVELVKIGFQSFCSAIFNTDIMFNTNNQGTTALETVIANYISGSWITSTDTAQVIQGLSVTTTTSTVSWGMNLKSDTEGTHYCIINFYDVLIRRAIEEYGIVIQTKVDYDAKTIALEIGKLTGSQTIEADLPNVFEKTFLINESSSNVNKLNVYNTANYSQLISYYKHPNGTYDTSNTNRITPVFREIQSATAEEGQTFAQAAASVAASVFGEVTYNNLIELTCFTDDGLINPTALRIGSAVSVIHEGVAYSSIMTGYKQDNNVITLIFGAIRADLTKLIRR